MQALIQHIFSQIVDYANRQKILIFSTFAAFTIQPLRHLIQDSKQGKQRQVIKSGVPP